MKIPTLEAVYLPPHGTPVYWQDELSGMLSKAIYAYTERWLDAEKRISDEDMGLVIAYLRYVINAPCWRGPRIAFLRKEAAAMQNAAAVDRWYDLCLDEGIDPI